MPQTIATGTTLVNLQLLDTACRELYFSTGASNHSKGSKSSAKRIRTGHIFPRSHTNPSADRRLRDTLTPFTTSCNCSNSYSPLILNVRLTLRRTCCGAAAAIQDFNLSHWASI